MPPFPCTACQASPSFGYFRDMPYCKECLIPHAYSVRRDPHDLIDLFSRIAALGELIPDAATVTAKRHLEETAESVAALDNVIARLPEVLAQRGSAVPKDTLGDALIGHDLQAMLDDGAYLLHQWLPEMEYGSFVMYCARHPHSSLAQILSDAIADEYLKASFDSVLYALLGSDLKVRALLEADHNQVLTSLNGFFFSLGLGRLASLAQLLRDGSPPAERYSEDERSLLMDLEPATVRRTSRSWHYLSALTSDLVTLNDRAERLLELWLLYPTKGPIAEYQQLLYRSYVHGHDAECIILCRSLLERTVKASIEGAHRASPEKMNEKLTLLRTLGLLSETGLRSARDIWTLGNHIVHKDPTVTRDPIGTIAATLAVVRELLERPDRAA